MTKEKLESMLIDIKNRMAVDEPTLDEILCINLALIVQAYKSSGASMSDIPDIISNVNSCLAALFYGIYTGKSV